MATSTDLVVLVVDPHEDSLNMYMECLQAAGFRPVGAPDGLAGWKRVPQSDILVTALRMPGPLDGFELVRRTRQHYPAKPIVVVSACDLPACLERAAAAGCDLFIPKPCLPETLIARIQEIAASVGHQTGEARQRRARALKARLEPERPRKKVNQPPARTSSRQH